MNFFKIKYFPNKIEDYLYFFFSNIIFIIIVVVTIQKSIDYKNSTQNLDEVMLFIPKVSDDYEEKRDLIFNQLSANRSIISLNKLEDKEIKLILSDLSKKIKLSEDIIPEVYDVQVDKSKPLNFILMNNKISKIIGGTVIKETALKKSNKSILFFISLNSLIFIILLNNFFLVKNYLFKIKSYINLSRYFGVSDAVIIKNINISFFILINLIFLLSYPIIKTLLEFYLQSNLSSGFFKIYIFTYFFYNFLFLSISSVQCSMYIKKLNVL